ncbi:rRNA pseudouridine synthase [Suttonella sp. R2A3]|uniref:pseudouridine synthase n=1 Tax=Suttonella sp. R2A3 TaxID=2908648 RepID=UPI001F294BC8|nr:pseudouridine synthase [Suttonella sp. R2A3]UJF25233.1 rRNA pseudouridine synthase [Suttonella sp. R2A3]
MKNEYERIQKWLAARGLGSRREIERWISEGRLRINGKPAELGQKINGHERLSLDGRPLRVSPEKDAPRQVLMYHKPAGEICTRKDPEGRRSVFRSLPKLRQGRWVSVGRLDLNTAGLLLFTNDGQLAHKLMHPSAEIEREYWVRVAGEVNEETLTALRQGMMLDDGFARFDDVSPLMAPHDDDTQYNRYYSVTLREGRNREVRRLWEAVGCQVSRLKRTRFGTVELPKELAAGRYRNLSAGELNALLNELKPKKTSRGEDE